MVDTYNYTNNNVFFDAFKIIRDIVHNNISDINNYRASLTDSKAKQWIFPSVPEKNDDMYPRVAILHSDASEEDYGAGHFVTNKYSGSVLTDTVYGSLITLPVVIAIFCKKEQRHQVTYLSDGTTHNIKNGKQADFMINKIAKELQLNRSEFITKNMDYKLGNITLSYEDNDFLWAAHMTIEVYAMNNWLESHNPDDLIDTIITSVTPSY